MKGTQVASMAVIAWMLACPSVADERLLTGQEIQDALGGNAVKGVQDGVSWKQTFHPSGTTTYISGTRPSPGRWAVRDDKYCSQWPPSPNWDCYTITGEGDRLTFVPDAGGASWPAHLIRRSQP